VQRILVEGRVLRNDDLDQVANCSAMVRRTDLSLDIPTGIDSGA
jgi:hypothetical protein